MKARDGERRKAGKIVWLKKKRACLFGTHVMNACWDNRCVVMSFSVCVSVRGGAIAKCTQFSGL